MKNTLLCRTGLGILLAAGALLPLGVASAQVTPAKPPVAPTNGKPARFGPPPPKSTAAVLTYRLRHDRRLDGSRIRVTAAGHGVGLYGSVPNLHQRRVARQIAQSIMGISYVADHMTVNAAPPPPASLVKQVQDMLVQDPVTKGAPITVTARQDVVTLQGTVANLLVKQNAIRHAHAVPHVTVVQEHITVPAGAVDDALASAVNAKVAADTNNPISHLQVLAKGGYVYLRGAAQSAGGKRRASDLAASVPGVTGLTNALTVLPAFLQKNLPAGR